MNAASAQRQFTYAALGVPAQPTGLPQTGDALRNRRRTFQPVNFEQLKAQCDAEKAISVVYDVEWAPPPPDLSARERIRRMLTVFPVRDVNWLIVILLLLGSATLLVNSFFGLLPLVAPSTNFVGEATVAKPATNVIGVYLFIPAGLLTLPAIWNSDKGTIEPVAYMPGREDEPGKVYRPALLGSSSWAWLPSKSDIQTSLRSIPFITAILQLLGLAIFGVSSVANVPGIFDQTNPTLLTALAFVPMTAGGAFIALANLGLLIFEQGKIELTSAAGISAFLNGLGSLTLPLTGVAQLLGFTLQPAFIIFIGRWAFLVGVVASWYDLMAFHPDSWAS
ncbi:hypothetical protein F4780DRAFT_249816 [Xylariomycetidae sp. FL0641]|nr:hypothetical protein F4780DRAFT_249816 [Xylariomycetidae sp. FL0641]